MASDVVVGNGPRILVKEEAAAASSEWDSLGTADLSALGIASCVDLVIAIIVLHVACNKTWPPYKTVIPELVMYTGLAVSRISKSKSNQSKINVARIMSSHIISQVIIDTSSQSHNAYVDVAQRRAPVDGNLSIF